MLKKYPIIQDLNFCYHLYAFQAGASTLMYHMNYILLLFLIDKYHDFFIIHQILRRKTNRLIVQFVKLLKFVFTICVNKSKAHAQWQLSYS